MLRKEAEREIICEWVSLPENERQTEHQAAQFALEMKRKYVFDYVGGDPYQEIRRMMLRHQHEPQRHANFQQVLFAFACDLKPVKAKQFVQDRQARTASTENLSKLPTTAFFSYLSTSKNKIAPPSPKPTA